MLCVIETPSRHAAFSCRAGVLAQFKPARTAPHNLPIRKHRSLHVSWLLADFAADCLYRLGSSVFFIYIVAFCFYMWIRVTKTLDLGQFIAYGIAILVIEIMGATATFIYGLNLILRPV